MIEIKSEIKGEYWAGSSESKPPPKFSCTDIVDVCRHDELPVERLIFEWRCKIYISNFNYLDIINMCGWLKTAEDLSRGSILWAIIITAGVLESTTCIRQGHDSLTSIRHYQGFVFSEDELRDIKKQLASWNLIK